MLRINLLNTILSLLFVFSYSKINKTYYIFAVARSIKSFVKGVFGVLVGLITLPFIIAWFFMYNLLSLLYLIVSSFYKSLIQRFTGQKSKNTTKDNSCSSPLTPEISNKNMRKLQSITQTVFDNYSKADSQILIGSIGNTYRAFKSESKRNENRGSQYVSAAIKLYRPQTRLIIYQCEFAAQLVGTHMYSVKKSSEYLNLFKDMISVDIEYTFDLTTGQFLKLEVVDFYDHNIAQSI